MMMWDGLRTKENERVLVLAATNRPFDLDEAVLRCLGPSSSSAFSFLFALLPFDFSSPSAR